MDYMRESRMDEMREMKANLSNLNPLENTCDLRRKLLTRSYHVKLKKGDKRYPSKVWQVFGIIETDTGETIPHMVGCSKCFRVFKYRHNTTSNLIKHKCYVLMKNEVEKNAASIIVNVEDETKKKIERLILQWTIDNCRPLDVIADSGLQKLAEYLIATGAKYGQNVDMEELLPPLSTIMGNVERLYTDNVERLKVEISTIRKIGYSLTIDLLRDEYLSVSYLFVTIHYVKNGELFNRLLGLQSIEGNKCADEEITAATARILLKFNCALDDKAIIVKGKSENMLGALQPTDNIFCINNVLQGALEKAIDETAEIRILCEVSNKIFNFLKDVSRIFISTIENISPKRWNTIYYMLSTIAENWDEAESHLTEYVELRQLRELLKVLEPFEAASKELENENGPTLHLTIAHIHRLRKLCVKNPHDLDFIKKFKVNLLTVFDTHIMKNITMHHKIALYLFPPAKKLISFSQSDKDLIRAEWKRIMETYIEDEAPESAVAYSAMQVDDKPTVMEYLKELSEEEEKGTSTSTNSVLNPDLFNDFVEPAERANSVEETVNSEIRLYEETTVTLRDNFNMLQWWHLHQAQFPLLYKTSCKILGVPATAITTEKAIMKARTLLFENRNAVDGNPDSVNEILFLHCNVEKRDMFYEVISDVKFLNSTNAASV